MVKILSTRAEGRDIFSCFSLIWDVQLTLKSCSFSFFCIGDNTEFLGKDGNVRNYSLTKPLILIIKIIYKVENYEGALHIALPGLGALQ